MQKHTDTASGSTESENGASPDAATKFDAWHTLSVDDISGRLNTDQEAGLTSAEAAERLKRVGPNSIAQAAERSAFSILISQFKSLIVGLLLVATVIAFAMNEQIEGAAILVVIFINAMIGFFTEWRAEQALTALQRQTVPVAHVVRDGHEHEIPAQDLVPGDLVVLSAGTRVPADGRILEAVRLQIEEAVLTGESVPVTKTSEPIAEDDAALGDRLNMAFLGTTITDGRGRMLVTSTGSQTEVGKIGTLINEVVARTSPLEQQLAQLGRLIIGVVLILCAVIVLAGWIRGTTDFWHMMEIGISLAIAAVPEGLPAATTMTLALGMQRMARTRALIRRLPAVETLGSVTVICTDKTGTLTRNEMTVRTIVVDQRHFQVTGTGYEVEGTFQEGNQTVEASANESLVQALQIGMLCNDAAIEREGDETTVLGDPTEAALVVVGEKGGLDRDALADQFPRIGEIPFNSDNKRMVTVHQTSDGQHIEFIKGSPGSLLADSQHHLRDGQAVPLTSEDRKYWEEQNEVLAGAALRVLALGRRERAEGDEEGESGNLVFIGLVGMSDPLREEAKSAIEVCRTAGIRTVMMTGDQQATAGEIARQLGIDHDHDGRPLRLVHGKELVDLDDQRWEQAVADAGVFARVSPEHKLRIVAALQRQGHVVAMTGDGVNDAPALKEADIGIAMGIKGTEVAKENSDMVITDDNFASIVGAIEQGRIIYGNIIRFIHYLFSCNLSEVITVFAALMIGWPLPLAALQILWLNLITDIFPAFALALEPSTPNIMKRRPRDPDTPILPPRLIFLITWEGLLLAAVTLLAFAVGLNWHGSEGDGLKRATTIAFMTLALSQVFHAFNARSRNGSAFTRHLFANAWLWGAVIICVLLQLAAVNIPLLQRVLNTVPPTSSEWALIVTCSLIPVAVVEIVKHVQRMAGKGSDQD
ncbi:cation-translocating P-type ATPase [Schlesneria sp. T3-172]|uniref:cation-translocating P-type ATPase n=1 Tax=Schlesneria sphaerica TaxID=3373610 RepID=UPI0037CCB459